MSREPFSLFHHSVLIWLDCLLWLNIAYASRLMAENGFTPHPQEILQTYLILKKISSSVA